MEFIGKKTPKSLNTAVRHNPYASGGKTYLNKFHNGATSSGSYVTPPRKPLYQRPRMQKGKSVNALFKPRNLSRGSEIIHKSISQDNSNKENSTDPKWINKKEELKSPLKSVKRSFTSLKADKSTSDPHGLFTDDDDDDEIFLSSKFEKKINAERDKENNNSNNRTPNSSLKVYENKRKPLNLLKSNILYDLSPEKVEASFNSSTKSNLTKSEPLPKYKFKSIIGKENTSEENHEPENLEDQSPVIQHPYLIGFPNYGNTCYLNAVLQTLVGLESFTVDISQIMRIIQVSESSLSQSLWNVISGRYRMDATAIRKSLRNMKENVERVDESFSGFKMQDANEFLTQVLDTIKDEIDQSLSTILQEKRIVEGCVTPEKPPSLIHPSMVNGLDSNHQKSSSHNHPSLFDTPSPDSPVTINFKLSDIVSDDEEGGSDLKGSNQKELRLTPDASLKSKDSSIKSRVSQLTTPERTWDALKEHLPSNPVKDNFEFQLLESYRCLGCGEVEARKQKHFALYVNLPVGSDTSIQNAVETYMGEDQRELTCEKCSHKNSSVITSFMKLPRVLIVQIKRYEYKPEQYECIKVSSKVDVNMWLHLDSVTSTGGQPPPTWIPKPLRISSKKLKPNTLSVRNLSSELNICEKSPDPSTNLNKTVVSNQQLFSPVKGVVVPTSPKAQEMEELVIHNVEDNEVQTQNLEQSNPDQEEEEFQRAIRLSLEDMGMCYTHEEESEEQQAQSKCDVEIERKEGEHSYKLMSVISHFGLTTCTGHYVSDIFNCKEGQWYHYDDESVAQLQESVVLAEGRQKNGYIFFYIHRDIYHQLRNKSE